MPSNKKNNYNFVTYFNFMEKSINMNDINSIVIKHINIKDMNIEKKEEKKH